MEKANFYEAAKNGNVEELKRILRNNPNVNLNWVDSYRGAALNIACEKGQNAVVSILLAHPAVDVNLKSNYFEATPFFTAGFMGKSYCVPPRASLQCFLCLLWWQRGRGGGYSQE